MKINLLELLQDFHIDKVVKIEPETDKQHLYALELDQPVSFLLGGSTRLNAKDQPLQLLKIIESLVDFLDKTAVLNFLAQAEDIRNSDVF